MKKRIVSFCLCVFVTVFALAPRSDADNSDLILPAGLQSLEAEAFENCADIQTVIAQEGLLEIGAGAFKGCGNLLEITLPASLETVGYEAVSGCSESLWVHCPPNSEALEWARSSGLDYDAGTVCRALAIGQTYTGTDSVLYGPANDARAVRFGLGNLQRTVWNTTMQTNLSASEIVSAVGSAFAEATENDISLFFFSGHGLEDGSLVGSDLNPVSPQMLRQTMDSIPGRKIVIVDACYSGKLISDDSMQVQAANLWGFTESFMSAFSVKTRGAFSSGSYFVMCSAGPRELAEEGSVHSGSSSRIMGYFTYALCIGFGWDGVSSRACAQAADANGDGAVSFTEAAAYAVTQANSFNSRQNGMYLPAGASWFAPFR